MKHTHQSVARGLRHYLYVLAGAGLLLGLGGCASAPSPYAAIAPAPRCAGAAPHDIATVAKALGWSTGAVEELEEERQLPHEALCTMSVAQIRLAMVEREAPQPRPDHPMDWAKQHALQQADEFGHVDPQGLVKALAAREIQVTRQRLLGREHAMAAGLSGSGAWTSLGPGNIGGRIRSMVTLPGSGVLLAGSAGGGIWRSTDRGATWKVVNDFMGSLAIGALTVDPNNGNTVYAGTGEGPTWVYGNGVYKSTDGGQTWKALPATSPSASASNYGFYWVDRIAVKPDDSRTLIAATNYGVFRSADGGNSWSAQMTKSTFRDVRFDPNSPSNAILSTDSGAVYYSTDAGQTWLASSLAVSGRIELAFAPNAAGVAYASVDESSGTIYKSSDSGATWAQVGNPKHLGDQGWYANALWVDPTDANRLLAAGLDIYRSVDGGASWQRVSSWGYAPDSAHADHHVLIADANFNGRTNLAVYNGDDGGVYTSTNFLTARTGPGGGWTPLNNGLPVTQFYSVASHPNGTIIGGAQDNGSLLYQGGTSNWVAFYGGDGGFSAMDALDPNTFYGEYVYLEMFATHDGGGNTNPIHVGITDAKDDKKALFIAPFVLDPNNSNRMYAGATSLWRSDNVTDLNPRWQAVDTTPGKLISAIAVAKTDPNIVWYGTTDGKLVYSRNALAVTPTWQQVASPLPARYIKEIFIDPDMPNKVFVGQGGFSDGNLRYSTDFGASWTVITTANGLPKAPVRAITRHPANPAWLYVGGEVGLYASEDGGRTWGANTDGPANVEVSQLSWMDSNQLLVATFGRGLFKATVGAAGATYLPIATGNLANQSLSVKVTPAPADVNQPGAYFVAAILPDGSIYLCSAAGWAPYDPNAPAPYELGVLKERTMPLLSGINLSGIAGTQVLAGYGRGASAAEAFGNLLATGQYKAVFNLR